MTPTNDSLYSFLRNKLSDVFTRADFEGILASSPDLISILEACSSIDKNNQVSEELFFKSKTKIKTVWVESQDISFWERWTYYYQVEDPTPELYAFNAISLGELLPVNSQTASLRLTVFKRVLCVNDGNVLQEPSSSLVSLHLGYSYLGLRHFEKSITFLQIALVWMEKNHYTETCAKIYAALGLAYGIWKGPAEVDNLALSIDFYKKSVALYNEIESPFEKAKTMANLGSSLSSYKAGSEQQNKELALTYLEIALSVPEFIASPFCAHAHQTIGNTKKVLSGMSGMDFYEDAINSLKTADPIAVHTALDQLRQHKTGISLLSVENKINEYDYEDAIDVLTRYIRQWT